MGKADVSNFRFDNDSRFLDLQKKATAVADQHSRLSARLIDATSRQRQAQATVDAINIKILMEEATEKDGQRARAERDRIDQEMVALRGALAEAKERLRAAHAAQSELESTLRAECRQRAMIAYRSNVAKLAPLLQSAAALNAELFQLFEFVNLPGLPGPLSELELHDNRENSPLGYWLRDAERFDWASYGA